MAGTAAAVRWGAHNVPSQLPATDVFTAWISFSNAGERAWPHPGAAVCLEWDGQPLVTVSISHTLLPGEHMTLSAVFRIPGGEGPHVLSFRVAGDLAVDGPEAFAPEPLLRLAVDLLPVRLGRTARLRDQVLENHARTWLACDGMSWSRSGVTFPNFMRAGRGCRLTDVEGREYVDYLMGWGCALLGYAHPRIRAAVVEAVASGETSSLTPDLMPEVAEALRERFPAAQAVTFGKNGSDACTAAVRLARAHTGRAVILQCGYHGWQDWFVERHGLAASGVPARVDPLVLPFQPNNLAQLEALLHQYRGRVAAVMVEPAGVIESFQGPVSEADAGFLHALIERAHHDGALVIFDELMTGFRHPAGSVQHATGLSADLTCLGKGLSAGLPLSAVIGRADVFRSALARIAYEPTFKAERCSLAAAREALRIYQESDVPARISAIGNDLRSRLDRLCSANGLSARVIGPAFRMLLAFSEPDARRRALMRTLLHQELLKAGVLSAQNLLLPCVAHDGSALSVTERAFDRALQTVKEASDRDAYASYLEIPPLPA